MHLLIADPGTLSPMSRTWFTADLHLGQHNIIGHCHRPYRGVAQMNADVVGRWNRVVADDDTVWVLGDVGAAAALPLVRFLRGTKHLISGNHDYCWPGNGPLAGATRWMYLAAGFATIRTTAEIELGGEHVTLSHFPYEGDSHGEDRFVPWRPRNEGGWIVHGHVHTAWRHRGRMINVGVDVWDYAPVAEETLVQLIRGGTG
jgi:calcineurin-like phosphoesterase family protein